MLEKKENFNYILTFVGFDWVSKVCVIDPTEPIKAAENYEQSCLEVLASTLQILFGLYNS